MRWTLTVQFDKRQVQDAAAMLETDYEERMFMRYLWGMWSGLPEENNEDIQRNGQTVTATSDVLDPLMEAIRWVGFHTVPVRLELTRNEDRM